MQLYFGGVSQSDKEEGLSSSGKNLQLLSGISAKISWIPYFIKTEKIESVIDEYNK